MKLKTADTLLNSYDLKLGKYYFYENYFIAEVKEGEVITLDKLDDLIPLVIKHYGDGRPFTYISDRIHSHAIAPMDYLSCPLNTMKNFMAYAVVTYNKFSEMTTEIEKHFAKRPFLKFQDITDAVVWAKKSIVSNN